MRREWIKIIVALVLLLGIAIPLGLHREKKMKEQIAEDESHKFVGFDLGKIDRIQLMDKTGSQVELQKRTKDGSGKFQDEFENRSFEFKNPPLWIITQPLRAIADNAKLEALIKQLENLSYEKVIQENQDRKSEYGLDHPLLTIRLFESKQSEPKLMLSVGGENTASTGNYFVSSNKPGIYLGDRTMQIYFAQLGEDWKERKIIDTADLNNIVSVGFNHARLSDSFVAERDNANWVIKANTKAIQGDRALLNEFVDHLNAMRFMKSFEDPSILKSSKKILTIDWKLKDHELIQITLYDGGKDKDIAFLQRSDLPQVFQIAGPDPKLLYTLQNVIDKHLFSAPIDQVTSIKVTEDSGKITEMHKEDKNWKMNKPVVDDGSAKRFSSFTQQLQEFEGTTYIENKTFNPKDQKMKVEYGLKDNKTYSITFFKESNKTFASIEDGLAVRNVVVRNIPGELYEHLSHFRSDELITLPPERLKSISLSKGEQKVEIQNNLHAEEWSVLLMENLPATVSMKWREQMTADELYQRLSETYVSKFLPERDPNDPYADIEVVINAEDGKAIHWKFGKKQGGMVNIYSPERNVAGQILSSKYDGIVEFLSEPKKPGK